MKSILALLVLLVFCGCASQPAAQSSPSATASATTGDQPTATPTASNDETPVARQALPPATDLPSADLCSKTISTTADGRATPLLCTSGAVNVLAWKFYASISASILGLGLNPTQGQGESAVCDDLAHNHATRPEEVDGFKLAATYYGWNFQVDPLHDPCV
jgi:hypothetical protein